MNVRAGNMARGVDIMASWLAEQGDERGFAKAVVSDTIAAGHEETERLVNGLIGVAGVLLLELKVARGATGHQILREIAERYGNF